MRFRSAPPHTYACETNAGSGTKHGGWSTACSMTGSIFTRRLSFFGRKSILEYFIVKAGAFHGFFAYVGESRIIKIPCKVKEGDR